MPRHVPARSEAEERDGGWKLVVFQISGSKIMIFSFSLRLHPRGSQIPLVPDSCDSWEETIYIRAKELNQLGLLLVEPEGTKQGKEDEGN
ncbi:hypothetical protein TURU_083123 [Turdus rufiventris]|nr:hypothetical protein TURU_083123 [Turdus rufiventris]